MAVLQMRLRIKLQLRIKLRLRSSESVSGCGLHVHHPFMEKNSIEDVALAGLLRDCLVLQRALRRVALLCTKTGQVVEA